MTDIFLAPEAMRGILLGSPERITAVGVGKIVQKYQKKIASPARHMGEMFKKLRDLGEKRDAITRARDMSRAGASLRDRQ